VDFVIIMVIMGTMGINLVKLFTPAAGIKDNAWREFSNKGIFSRDYQSFFFQQLPRYHEVETKKHAYILA
jgi:hypothetical protein